MSEVLAGCQHLRGNALNGDCSFSSLLPGWPFCVSRWEDFISSSAVFIDMDEGQNNRVRCQLQISFILDSFFVAIL